MTALDDALWPRAALPRRPMLGAVLDALTVPDDPRPPLSHRLTSRSTEVEVVDAGVMVRRMGLLILYPWVTPSPAEAYELLQARGIIPMECRSRFTCERCHGSGRVVIDYDDGETMACHLCDNGHRPHPPTAAALASWASLGFAAGDDDADDAHVTIVTAEDLARELNDGAEVRWQVAPRTSSSPPGSTWPPAIEVLWRGGLDVLRGHTRTVLYVPPLGLVTP